MLNPVRVLVYGGRDFKATVFMHDTLDYYLGAIGSDNLVLIEGEAPGADRLAKWWAEDRVVEVEVYPADWERYGKKAGPIRNKQMRDEGKPDFGIAFPGGHGTAGMTALLREKNIPVIEVNI